MNSERAFHAAVAWRYHVTIFSSIDRTGWDDVTAAALTPNIVTLDIMFFGGISPAQPTDYSKGDAVLSYDPGSNRWSSYKFIPELRCNHTAVIVGIMAVGIMVDFMAAGEYSVKLPKEHLDPATNIELRTCLPRLYRLAVPRDRLRRYQSHWPFVTTDAMDPMEQRWTAMKSSQRLLISENCAIKL
ncbi:hypothetical protein V5799_004106 [Amblyomma americanum]|uniref:Uncharacterized protein n=1 Tax=Amblyomma americanum TaxID=6943 RepID=A0AAQ4D722_AMBAM